MQEENKKIHRADLQEALQVSKANYETLVETVNSVILRMDHTGVITYINRFGREFFGFEEAEILGRSPLETILPETFSDGTGPDFFEKLFENTNAFAVNTNENIKKDGTRVWVSWSNRGEYDEDGNLTGILCVGNDITRLKLVETELSRHREDLERLVADRTRELSRATAALIRNQNRLMVLNSISSCIIQEKSAEYIILSVLDQLAGIFENCRTAYSIIRPGAGEVRVDYCRGPDTIADMQGRVLSIPKARPFIIRLIRELIPHVVNDIDAAPEKEVAKEFIGDNAVQAYIMVPLHRHGRIIGVLHVYSPVAREWEKGDIELLEQIGGSLCVAVLESLSKARLVEQEQFLENVFDGVDIGILVLGVGRDGGLVVENVNQRFRALKGILKGRIAKKPMDVLGEYMPEGDLARLKSMAARCIREQETVRFLEQTPGDDGPKTWLTRLTPIRDAAGSVFRIIGASTDITEQKQAEQALQEKEARLTEAHRIARLGDCERDAATLALSCSKQLMRIFGWDETLCPGHDDFLGIVHPEDRAYVNETIAGAVALKKPYDMEYRILKQGMGAGERFVNEIGEIVTDPSGRAVKISGIVQDITQQKRFRDEIELARTVFDNALEGVVVTNRNGTIQFVNKGFTRITGYEPEEVIGKNPRLLKSDRHNRTFYKDMWESLDANGHWAGEIWNRRKNGEAYPEWLSIAAINDRNGRPVRYMSVFNDLSDIREREKQIHFQTNYDALTGLPNRTLLVDRIKMAIRRTFREKRGLSLIFLDLDDFKHVNDTLGHVKGDILLQEFARRLVDSVREQDTVTRYGGDDFVILLPDTRETESIIQIIDRIKTALGKPFRLDKKEFFMGASMGITICPDDGIEPDVLIANADMAMYRAKERGKGRYGFFTPELNKQVAKRFELENDLRLALKRSEFALYYQPKLSLKTNRVCGAEALVRWIHPEKGVIPPMAFIPLAEETGMIVQMGDWILNRACQKAAEWSGIMGETFNIAVNISPLQVKDVDLADLVKKLLARHGISSANLELEITENALMGNVEKARTLFDDLHAMGIHISIDDFGTGFSSLSYLRLFPIQTLKIDKSFVDDIPHDAGSNTMVETIIAMAGHLNLRTIAEGVETREQFDFLKNNGCDQIQGYYFSPPLPEDQFARFLQDHRLPPMS